jgi:hypothetical protein
MGYLIDTGNCCFCGCGNCGVFCPCDPSDPLTSMPSTLLCTVQNNCGTYEFPITWLPSTPGGDCAWYGMTNGLITLGCIEPGTENGCCCNQGGGLIEIYLYCNTLATTHPSCDGSLESPEFMIVHAPVQGTPTPGVFNPAFQSGSFSCRPLNLVFSQGINDLAELPCSQSPITPIPCFPDMYTITITEMPTSGCWGYCVYGQTTVDSFCSQGCGCSGSPGSPGAGCPDGQGLTTGTCS